VLADHVRHLFASFRCATGQPAHAVRPHVQQRCLVVQHVQSVQGLLIARPVFEQPPDHLLLTQRGGNGAVGVSLDTRQGRPHLHQPAVDPALFCRRQVWHHALR
jgi:hypothetical protein